MSIIIPIVFVISQILSIEAQGVSVSNNFVESNNRLALSLLKVLPKSENNFYSPLSISSGLMQLLNGANGLTATELRNLLNIQNNVNINSINEDLKNILTSITQKNTTDVTTRLVNKLLVSTNYQLLEGYENYVKNNFNTSIDSVDFNLNSLNITKNINDWVRNTTNGKIDKLFDALNRDIAFIMANVIYFSGKWEYPFDEYLTRDDEFFSNGSENSTTVRMMSNTRRYSYLVSPELNASLIELPFDIDSNISMIILLPNQTNGLSNVTELLTCELLLKELTELRNRSKTQLALSFPKFEMQSDYDLKLILRNMNISTLFENTADLSLISNNNLKVSKAVHKAVIKVNEKGAEAAGVTGIIGVPHIFIPPTDVKVNKPFIFLIQDKSTGVLLFLGQVQEI